MKILIGCERSGKIREAFRRGGHDAWSCDLEWSDRYHIQCDILKVINDGWDMMIAHPPCTYLCNSGVWNLMQNGMINEKRWKKMEQACRFFLDLWNCSIPKVVLENPIMHAYAKTRIAVPYSQIVQPFEFGHPETKQTCLWLRGVEKLRPTNILERPITGWLNQTAGGNTIRPPNRSKTRAVTYQGIADAMANQWGGVPIPELVEDDSLDIFINLLK